MFSADSGKTGFKEWWKHHLYLLVLKIYIKNIFWTAACRISPAFPPEDRSSWYLSILVSLTLHNRYAVAGISPISWRLGSGLQVSSMPAKMTKTKALFIPLYKQCKLIKDNEEKDRQEEAPRKSLLKFKIILENRWWEHKYSTATKDLSTLPMSTEGIFSQPAHHFLLRNSTPQEVSIILLLAEANWTITTFLELTLQQSILKSNIDYAFIDYRIFRKTLKAKQGLEELSSTSRLA